jgi:MFS family permease
VKADFGDFQNLLAYEFFKNFVLSMLGIFIPILIYSETNSLILPGVYLMAKALTGVLVAYPVMRVLNSYGFRSGLSASYVFLLPSIVLIYFLKPSLITISVVGVLYSIGAAFHTESRDLEFAESSSREERDMHAAHLASIPSIGRLIGPAVGGAISAFAGFQAMLATAFTAALISIIPARNIKIKSKASEISLKSVLSRKNISYSPVFISRGVQAYASVALFSLFTYIFVAGDISSGLVRSMDILGFMIMAYFSGYISSKYSRLKIIAAGSVLAGIIYISRIYVTSPVEAFLVSVAGGLAFKLYDIPLFSDFADRAEDSEERSFYAAKKIFNSTGKALTIIVFLAAATFSTKTAFNTVFILAAASTATMIITQRIHS